VHIKAEGNVKSNSLRKYKEAYDKETRLRVRFSMSNLTLDNDLLNIPLFLADEASRIIKLALSLMSF
jgi:hypothetical protein